MKKTTPRYIIIKLFRTCDKQEDLKEIKRKCYIEGDKDKSDSRSLMRNSIIKKTIILKYWGEKKPLNLEF